MATAEEEEIAESEESKQTEDSEEVSQLKKVAWKVVLWLGGGVAFGLLPIWIELAREGSRPSTNGVLEKGDLLIASAVICAGAATDRLGRGLAKYDFLGLAAVISAFLVFLGNTVYYSNLDCLAVSSRAPLSIWLFVFAIVSGGACVVTKVEA